MVKTYIQASPAIFIVDNLTNSSYLDENLLHKDSTLTVIEGIVTEDKNNLFGVGFDLLNLNLIAPAVSLSWDRKTLVALRYY